MSLALPALEGVEQKKTPRELRGVRKLILSDFTALSSCGPWTE